jgi:hypothetical protein
MSRTYDPDKPLISLHIPKCGGTSLKRVLQKWFGKHYYKHYRHPQKRAQPPRRKLTTGLFRKRNISRLCIHGHFGNVGGHSVADYYPQVDQFITMLRDPFEVMVSRYFYARKLGPNRFLKGKRTPISDQFKSFEEFLAGTQPTFLRHLPFDLTLENYRQILDEHFVAIGITDESQKSVDQLALRLGYPSETVPHNNPSQRDEPVPEHLREQWLQRHPLEVALYEYARDQVQRAPAVTALDLVEQVL